MAGDPVTSKRCVRCDVDVAGARRVKDKAGRYLCGACYDKAMSVRRSAAGIEPVMPVPAAATTALKDQLDSQFDDQLDGRFDDQMLDAEALLAEEASAPPLELVEGLACPGCSAALTPEAAICVSCGYNVREGKAHKTRKGREQSADDVNARLKASRAAERSSKRREQSRVEYTKAGAWCIGSLLVSLFVTASLAEAPDAGVAVAEHLIGFGVGVLFATAVYFGCCLLWIGFDQPWKLIAIKMGAVHAILGLLSIPLEFLGIIGSVFQFIAYATLLQHFMDLELQDALILAVMTALAAVLAVVVVISVLLSQGGLV